MLTLPMTVMTYKMRPEVESLQEWSVPHTLVVLGCIFQLCLYLMSLSTF